MSTWPIFVAIALVIHFGMYLLDHPRETRSDRHQYGMLLLILACLLVLGAKPAVQTWHSVKENIPFASTTTHGRLS